MEGQLLDRQPLDQGEDPAALGRVDEVVGVLDARGDGLDGQQLAGIVLGQPVLELLIGDDGEDGHGADPGAMRSSSASEYCLGSMITPPLPPP